MKKSLHPSVLVVGTGAVGSLYGGKLSQSGASVSVLCRSDYDSVKTSGIFVKSHWGDFSFQPEEVYRFSDKPLQEFDYILVALKVLPEISVPDIISRFVTKKSSVVLLQNGIDIEEPVAHAFPDAEIISGIAFTCVSRTSPGKIHHMDYGRLKFGLYPKGLSKKTQDLCFLFGQAGVPCDTTDNIRKSRWQKLVWNAPFNPISVLCGGATTREILDLHETRGLVEKIMEEVLLIAEKTGNALPLSVIKKNIDDTKNMKPYKTSMCLDFESKRPMEVEAILGNAVRIARETGARTPCLETLYGLLKLIDEKNKKNPKFETLNPKK
ncbi:MAG: 2-dehydropantoate 2-reductase [Candidatus Aureabacteria bacterium]|nr:2-dehydropantoate 2-reductase [Candidatus Auribacterota bacterium]